MEREPCTHVVKSWPQFFSQIIEERRMHELRRNDRDYQVGDVLMLKEFEPSIERFTGRYALVEVTSMTSAEQVCAVSHDALHPDFCILSVKFMLQGAIPVQSANSPG